MTAKRKTVEIAPLKEWANWLLAQPDSEYRNPMFRKGIATMLEKVLVDSGNYHGFNYVDWLDHGYKQWLEDGQPEDNTKYLGDQSKVYFY
jgi:hypothetical protein